MKNFSGLLLKLFFSVALIWQAKLYIGLESEWGQAAACTVLCLAFMPELGRLVVFLRWHGEEPFRIGRDGEKVRVSYDASNLYRIGLYVLSALSYLTVFGFVAVLCLKLVGSMKLGPFLLIPLVPIILLFYLALLRPFCAAAVEKMLPE